MIARMAERKQEPALRENGGNTKEPGICSMAVPIRLIFTSGSA
jgi:hypothetical protein